MSEDELDPRTHARADDPDTSHESAEHLSRSRRAGVMIRQLLEVYATGPCTAEEASDLAGYTSKDGAWKRCSDLAALGLIEDTGDRRKARSGRRQMVRGITQPGWLALGSGKPIGPPSPPEPSLDGWMYVGG